MCTRERYHNTVKMEMKMKTNGNGNGNGNEVHQLRQSLSSAVNRPFAAKGNVTLIKFGSSLNLRHTKRICMGKC